MLIVLSATAAVRLMLAAGSARKHLSVVSVLFALAVVVIVVAVCVFIQRRR